MMKLFKTRRNEIPNSVKLIDKHLDKFFNNSKEIEVLHEIESEVIHSDVYIIKANEERPFNILLTCGMSALPMNVPKDIDASRFAEVMMLLPIDWNLNYESFEDERNYWPIRILKELSKLPHMDNTWLGYGHTFGHSPEEKEFAKGVGFNSVILLESIELSRDFSIIKNRKKTVEIFTVIPLYIEELEFKMKFGTSKLLEKFEEICLEEIVQVGRRNLCL